MTTALLIIALQSVVLAGFWVWDERARRAQRRLRHDRQAKPTAA